MSHAHLNDELFSDLAMRLVTGASAHEAIQHIASCPTCEQRFREIASEWEHAAVRVDEILPHKRDADGASASRPGLWANFVAALATPAARWAGATAVVAALLITMVPRLIDSPDRVGLTRLPPLTPDVLPRAVLPNSDNDKMLEGLDAYARKDFESAITALEQVDATGPVDALRRVYLASAFAWTGRHEKAIDTLEGVPLHAVPDPWSAEARWTLYLSLTETGQIDRALSVLRKLAETPGEAGNRARALIVKLPSPR